LVRVGDQGRGGRGESQGWANRDRSRRLVITRS
jgi:hypothetical protein